MKVFLIFLAGILLNITGIAQDHISNKEVVQAIAPIYPALACFGKLNGSVKLEVTINPDGAVIDTKGVDGESIIYKRFGPVSEYAAKRWKFVSATNGMKERKYIITFVFHMMKHDATLEDITTIYRAPFEMEVRCRMREPFKFDAPNTSMGESEETPTNTR